MSGPDDPLGAPGAAGGEGAEVHLCTACSSPMSGLGAQPFRTGGLPGYPDAVLWLDTYWCPQCGRMAFFTVR